MPGGRVFRAPSYGGLNDRVSDGRARPKARGHGSRVRFDLVASGPNELHNLWLLEHEFLESC